MEKKMENEMEYVGVILGYIGFSIIVVSIFFSTIPILSPILNPK